MLFVSETTNGWETSQMTTGHYVIITLKEFLSLKHEHEELASSFPQFPLLFPIH